MSADVSSISRLHHGVTTFIRGDPPGWNVGAFGYRPDMANFAVTLAHGPGWDATRPIRSQDGWDEHAAFMDGLVEDGFLIVGGPLGDGARTLHLVQGANEAEVRDRFGADPWAAAGLLQIASVQSWALWLDWRQRDPVS